MTTIVLHHLFLLQLFLLLLIQRHSVVKYLLSLCVMLLRKIDEI